MERKKHTLFAVLAAAVIVAAVFSSFAISLFWQKRYDIRLPDLSEQDPSVQPDGDEGAGGWFIRLEVSPETVQNVIATLSRPQSYYREISIELYAGQERSVTTARVWVDGSWTRSEVTSPNGTLQHNLVGPDTRWLWYGSSSEYVSFPAGGSVSDLVQRIPTYEDVLELPQSEITATGYETYSGADCIFVEVEQPDLDSSERYWIASSNGLLIAAERVKDGEVVYRMTALSTESPAPLDSSFALPDGTVLHTLGEEEV